MSAQALLFVLLALACPLMMVFMMRGHGHGHGGHRHADHGEYSVETPPARVSLEELRDQVDKLNAQIRALEEEERRTVTAARSR